MVHSLVFEYFMNFDERVGTWFDCFCVLGPGSDPGDDLKREEEARGQQDPELEAAKRAPPNHPGRASAAAAGSLKAAEKAAVSARAETQTSGHNRK